MAKENGAPTAERIKFSTTPAEAAAQNTHNPMKIPYFKIGEAFQEAKDSFSYGSNTDKVSSTAKLLGKSVANIGLLAVEIGVDAVKRAPEHMGKVAQENLDKRSHLMTEEQVAKAREVIEKANQAKAQRLEREREADQQERHRE